MMLVREQLYKRFKDGTWARQTRSGSYRMVREEDIPKCRLNKIYVLALVDLGVWVPGVGGRDVTDEGDFYYVEL